MKNRLSAQRQELYDAFTRFVLYVILLTEIYVVVSRAREAYRVSGDGMKRVLLGAIFIIFAVGVGMAIHKLFFAKKTDEENEL